MGPLRRMLLTAGCRVVVFLGLLGWPHLASAQQTVRFNRDVRSLLADRCFPCHGPDEQDREAGLRLDRSDGLQGAYRTRDGSQAIRPGSLRDSEIWYRLTTDDESEAMPPADSHKDRLTAEEQALIRRWIEQGASYEDHWAFVTPTEPAAAVVEDRSWSQQPLDRFVLRTLEASNMNPSARADQRTLIRRVSFDLTGLPPTRDEIHAFLSAAAPGAYERLVDRLLAMPQYGEHMTKYWLDLVRFADTNGVHHDHYRDMTPYRDWVIRSWNANLPYDQFVTEQLAGDLYPEPTDDQLTASGFNRLHMIIDRGTALPEESLARNVIDRVTAVGTAFLGLTVQCAVCHDHKYDPVTQRDFYQLSAFFNNFDGAPETGSEALDKERGLQPPYISFPTDAQEVALADLARQLDETQAQVDSLQQETGEAADEARKQALTGRIEESKKTIQELQAERKKILVTVPAAMVMRESAEIRPAHILIRGAYDNPGERVERKTPVFLPPMKDKAGVRTRMDLAQWLVSGEHPLTARVAVNRLWQQFFGVGIVKTSEDFGTEGDWPSHMDLLDHLSVSFVESGWDVKALVKQLVMSETYRQSSVATPESFERDPENRLLSRGSRFRMDAEMIRDQILASSGLLNRTMYGRSVKPPQPAGIWQAVTLPSSFPRTYMPDSGDDILRRSVYTFWKRGMPPPQMSMLNAPTREACTARRERTNTPLQALLLLNETEYLRAARHLASAVLSSGDPSPQARLERIYESITSRLPDTVESDALLQSVRDLEVMYGANPALAAELCAGTQVAQGHSEAELAAWTLLVSTVYNLDITKTRE